MSGAPGTAQAGPEETHASSPSTPGRSDSLRPARIRPRPRRAVDRECRDAASLPDQPAMLAFLRVGGGHPIERRRPNRGGADRQIAEEGFDSRIEPEPQPAVEGGFQKRGIDLTALGGVPGLLSALGRRRHASGIGARLGGAQTGRRRSGPRAAQGGRRGEEMFRHCWSRHRAGKILVLLDQAAMRKAESQTHPRSRESLN